ncbi:hypothetical protein ACJVDH_12765 [Pedobacter sp. AW1-32]|uniref:hypothetical protein n=1 Tax=Pedobacter sp. AW1-32 TaxID=3383026 RepID=UPI003FEE49A5
MLEQTPFNHEADLIHRTEKFIKCWFKQTLSPDLSDFFILPGNKVLERKVIVSRLKGVFGASDEYVGGRYDIIDSDFNLLGDGKGMGFVEGVAGFRAMLNKQYKIVSGPFKLYFALQEGHWKIVNIEFPGFSY